MNAPLGASLEFLRRVEVLRGPASSLYGSDAIGGVIGYFTLEPDDLLERGQRLGARARLGYSGANEGTTATLLGAGRGESVEWLLGYTQTDSHEFDNQGELDTIAVNRTRPNPQDLRDRGALAKFALRPAAGHTLSLAVEAREQDAEIQLLRFSSALPRVSRSAGEDLTRRTRGSLDWEHKPRGGWYERMSARLYHQNADTDNLNRQSRTNTSAGCAAFTVMPGTNTCRIEQDFLFEQTATGAGVEAHTAFGKHHLLAFGVDLSRVRTEQLRDVRVWNLTTGTFTKSLAGDTFPLRDFAPGYTDTLGIFVQDEIVGLAGGRLTLTPGLRYDRRRLEPEPDALSQGVLAAIGRQAVSQTDSALSPKLAGLWQFAPTMSVYGQIVRGFRAPNYEEVNGHFRQTAMSYGISPNPDLEPETSTGVEIGARLSRTGLSGQLALFDNHYRDFISSVRLACPADPNCIAGLAATFMSVNLSRVRIYGAEARLAWEFAPGWRLAGALARARGTDEGANQPLDSVEPTRLSLALARDAGTWGAEARLRAATAVKRVNDFSGATLSPWFRPPAYEVFDSSVWWKPARQIRLSLAVNNLFDEKYWLWSDIRQADARNPAGVDFYSQPGRSVSATVQYAF
ncbi:MAG TPA: TonB-dependent hemoglobin/transferrin/lactoferrin family receptor, partial [Steroidobacteraceae bacterium]|nr:TonB-dependent hemoglobin/transferrin/lactoferrin family receptor [Steroidobacteraceae bacterium]